MGDPHRPAEAPAAARRSRLGALQLAFALVAGAGCLVLLWGAANSWWRAAGCLVCGATAYWLGRRAVRSRAPVFRDADAALDLARRRGLPVFVYLRRFSDDATSDLVTSDEEELAAGLGSFGLFLALGRPGEELPVRGAYRLYVDDDRWRSVVHQLVEEAAVVLFRWAPGGELGWELEQVEAAGMAPRSAFLLPRLAAGREPVEFLPPALANAFVAARPARLSEGSLPALVAMDEEGRVRLFSGGGDSSGVGSVEDLAAHFAEEHLGLEPLERGQRLALRRIYGRAERWALTVARLGLAAALASLGLVMAAFLGVLLGEPLRLPLGPLDWVFDHLELLGAVILVGLGVSFLLVPLVTKTVGRT